MSVKKATSKRERKYGKKNTEEKVEEKKPIPVKVIVDGYRVLNFKSISLAEEYINKKNKEADRLRRKPTSFIIV